MKFEHTPKQMAEKLMEFIRDISDEERELKNEMDYMATLFEKLQKSEEYNALAHHLDTMFMCEAFSGKNVADEEFTMQELAMMSEGMLALIGNVNNAKHYLYDQEALDTLGDVVKKYQRLNAKICKKMM